MSVKIDDSQLIAAIARIKGQSQAAYRAGVEAGAKHLADRLKESAPKRTGKAAATITMGEITATDTNAEAEIGPTGARWYLRFHEEGTSKMSAHPFIGPTVGAEQDEIARKAGEAFLTALGL